MGFIDCPFTNIADPDFPENRKSIMRGRQQIPLDLIELYHGLEWKPIDPSPLISDGSLDYDNSMKILDFNRDLSSLLGIICNNRDMLKMYFS